MRRELAEARIDLVRLGWGRPDPTYRQMFVARFLPEGTQEQWRGFDELQRRSTSAANAVAVPRRVRRTSTSPSWRRRSPTPR